MKRVSFPLCRISLENLRAGEEILFSGILYTARDQAHKRFLELMKQGKSLPMPLAQTALYYCGPTAAAPERIIGSCGPTTSARMDAFTPFLIQKGLRFMVGKGRRSQEVQRMIKKYKAVYCVAPSGCGAFLSTKVTANELIAFPELGPEAVYRLEVEEFPLIVAIDTKGESIYGEI